MLVHHFEIIGVFEKECGTDRDRRKVITARRRQVAVIPEEVGAKLERLGLIGSIAAILGVCPARFSIVGKRLIEGVACIIRPAGLVITIGKKTPRSRQQKSIFRRGRELRGRPSRCYRGPARS